MRKPRIFTWWSIRPRNSRLPSGSQRTRSPVRYSRAPGSPGERIRHEALRRQLRTLPVAARHPRAPDVQLPGHPHRHRLEPPSSTYSCGLSIGRPIGIGPSAATRQADATPWPPSARTRSTTHRALGTAGHPPAPASGPRPRDTTFRSARPLPARLEQEPTRRRRPEHDRGSGRRRVARRARSRPTPPPGSRDEPQPRHKRQEGIEHRGVEGQRRDLQHHLLLRLDPAPGHRPPMAFTSERWLTSTPLGLPVEPEV